MGSKTKSSKKLQAPKGTRDLYPADVLKRRYIQNAWRDASLRCGFDEIEGPTFETTDLYSIKSGEGILGELFQAFSGKGGQETLDKLVENGQADFALRPEFTPTLARMYAAKSKELTKPCKWFTAGPYFRAERPQRGRLREFLQWNCDIIGADSPEEKAQADVEAMECAIRIYESLGFSPADLTIQLNDREVMAAHFSSLGVTDDQLTDAFTLLDKREKLPFDALSKLANEAGFSDAFITFLTRPLSGDPSLEPAPDALSGVLSVSKIANLSAWQSTNFNITRGLAYYTGTVFEALADGERAVAGGGRYDNLIELMGGPSTPAVGFAMGDVVLGNLLEDKGLMPESTELMEAVSRPQASIRPIAFVVPNGDEANEPLVHTLVSNLRRGVESADWLARDDRKPWQSDRYSVAPMHARVSYKSTRNIGKLRGDAEKQHARFFVEIQGADNVVITDLDKRETFDGRFSVDPVSSDFAGAALLSALS
jgi:histidyl-tRNA synthetase